MDLLLSCEGFEEPALVLLFVVRGRGDIEAQVKGGVVDDVPRCVDVDLDDWVVLLALDK